jgi:hypothetical protein
MKKDPNGEHKYVVSTTYWKLREASNNKTYKRKNEIIIQAQIDNCGVQQG